MASLSEPLQGILVLTTSVQWGAGRSVLKRGETLACSRFDAKRKANGSSSARHFLLIVELYVLRLQTRRTARLSVLRLNSIEMESESVKVRLTVQGALMRSFTRSAGP